MPGDAPATLPPTAGPLVADPPAVGRPAVRSTTTAWVWLGVAAIAGAAGWYKTINLFVLAAYVLVGLFAVNLWLAWRAATRVAGRRADPGPVFPGEPAVVYAEVTNASAAPVTAVVAGRAGDNRSAWLLAPLGPGETRALVARWAFPARGRYVMPPLEVDGAYPFGLIHVRRPVTPAGAVRVLPAVGRVDLAMFRRWLVRGGGGDGRARRPSRRPAAGLGDVRGLRAYRPGDSPRDVHWKSSARRNQLLVREYDHTEPLDLRLVVDPWAPAGDAGRPDGAARRLEWVLSLTATLVAAWCEADDPADLTVVVAGAPPVVRAGRASPVFLRDALAPLAEVTGSAAVPAVPAAAVRGRSARTVRVVVSTRPDGPLPDALRRAGVAVAVVDATAPPAWFTPPAAAPAPR